MKEAENELMRRAQALKKQSSFRNDQKASSSAGTDNGGDRSRGERKKGFFASLFGRK